MSGVLAPLSPRRLGTMEDASSMLGLSYNQTRKLNLPIIRVGRRVLVDLTTLSTMPYSELRILIETAPVEDEP